MVVYLIGVSIDIQNISHNTGIPKEIINKVKNHLFLEKHLLEDGLKHFDPNPDISAAWFRLQNDTFYQSDLKLLQHEFAEALIMDNKQISYSEAHYIANKFYNWEDHI